MSWTDNGSGASDYDLYIYKIPRSDCNPNDCTSTDGSQADNYQSASSSNPEIATISPLSDGTQKYTLVVVPYTPGGESVNVSIELAPGSGSGGGTPGFGGPDPTQPGVPRYQNFYAPAGTSAQSSAGEFNIGFNPHSGRIMTMNLGPVWRITPPELLSPAKPECCEGLWEDVSNPTTNTGLDPILWIDQTTGRTFTSNSTAGANAVYGYSDNDGDLWVPLAVSPPSGGTDHETIASGPFPASLATLSTAANQDEPVPTGQPLEGHARVAVGTLNKSTNTITWTSNFDIGASHGIKNAAEIEAVGGSIGRAAVGFLGTDIAGDYQAISFPGDWYAFIATTYDGGATWTTVNATPNDPVQSMTGIWQQGGSHQDRNLLDFNEITVDDKGHVLYGYSDGCVTEGCIDGTAAHDFVAFMRVARQSGGKTIFASNDNNTDTTTALVPKPPCLSGIRFATVSHLSWKVPDNGGSDITGYQILRGTAAGGETMLVTNTGDAKTSYDDTTVDSSVTDYFYEVKAINAVGTGNPSNEIDLPVTTPPPAESICAAPGITELTDPSGDTSAVLGIVSTPAPPGSDLLSFQLAQPYATDNVIRLAFTINTDNGESPQPLGSSWYVAMKIPEPAPATTSHYKAVHMTWNGATPTFESYTPAPNGSGGIDGRFVTSGSHRPGGSSR